MFNIGGKGGVPSIPILVFCTNRGLACGWSEGTSRIFVCLRCVGYVSARTPTTFIYLIKICSFLMVNIFLNIVYVFSTVSHRLHLGGCAHLQPKPSHTYTDFAWQVCDSSLTLHPVEHAAAAAAVMTTYSAPKICDDKGWMADWKMNISACNHILYA